MPRNPIPGRKPVAPVEPVAPKRPAKPVVKPEDSPVVEPPAVDDKPVDE